MDRVPDDELISAYLDDELSAEERAYVERLLVERPEARRLLDELRGVRESLQALPSYRLEPDFGAAVLRQAEREVLRAPANGQVLESKIESNTVEPRRDVVDGGSSISAPPDGPRWKRPLAWSMLAVAAAVVLMFVNRQAGDRERPIALQKANEEAEVGRDTANFEATGDRVVLEKRGASDEFARPKTNAPAATTAPDNAYFSKSGAVAGAPATNDVAMPKGVAPADQPFGGGGGIGGAFNVGLNNGTLQPAAPTDGGQMSVFNSLDQSRGVATPNTAPPGHFAVDNRVNLSKAGAGTIVLDGANKYLEAGAAQSLSTLQTQVPSGQIDTRPLVAAIDFERAKTLVAELQGARRDSKNENEALRAFSQRSSVAQADKAKRQAPSQSPANDQLLIVTIEVPNEAALEGCLLPVLQQQQIADLTPVRTRADVALQLGITVGNYGPPPAEATREADAAKAAEPHEEYFYVVANKQQIQGTLEALYRQPEMIVDVEPAPANESQQAWSAYSRGYDDGGKAKVAAGPTSSTYAGVVNQPVAKPAAPPAVAAPASEGMIAKKSEAEPLQERKNSDVAGKQLDGITGNRALDRSEQNAAALKVAEPALGEASQQEVASQQADAYGLGLVPLSRSQRLRGIDSSSLQIAPLSDPQMRARFSVQDRLAGEKSPAAAATGAVPAIAGSAGPTMSSTPAVSVPSASAPLPSAPAASAPLPSAASVVTSPTSIASPQPASSAVAAKAKDGAGGGGAPGGFGTGAQMKQDGASEAQVSQQQFGYALPPDFHEALFICRVAPQVGAVVQKLGEGADAVAPAKPANAPTAGPAPAALDAKPTATQPTAPQPSTTPRGKAE